MTNLYQDLRFAARGLRRSPLFVVIAMLVIGIGIGASVAIFSLMDALLLRPVPGVLRPAEMAGFERWQAGQLLGDLGYPDYLDYSAQLQSFSGVIAEAGPAVTIARHGAAERLPAAIVSGNYFAVLGVQPMLGRLIAVPDDVEGRNAVAVLSFSYWQRAFAKNSAIVGQSILINGHPFTVIGVAQPEFSGTVPQSPPALWLPITSQPVAMPAMTPGTLQNRSSGWLRVFARRKPGVPFDAAAAEVSAVASRLAAAYPLSNLHRNIALVPGLGLFSDDRSDLRRFLALLLFSVELLQLIGCANLANLLLARAAARRHETAVRLALGATRVDLLRLSMAEALLIAIPAAALGVLIAPVLARAAALVQQPAYGLAGADIRLNVPILLFAVLVTFVSALLVGSAPAWQAMKVDVIEHIKNSGAVTGGPKARLRGALIAVQIAFSLVLLTAGAAAIQTMRRAMAASPIPEPGALLLCSLDLSTLPYSPESAERFFQLLGERARNLHGVTAATFGSAIPPEEFPGRRSIFYPGQEPPPDVLSGREFELGIRVDSVSVAPGFFATLGIPLVEGRDFSPQDRAGAPRIAIVNQQLAERMWPGKDPIGERIAVPEWGARESRPPFTVVGVAKNVAAHSLLSEVPLQLYLPYSQELGSRRILVLRSRLDQAQLLSALRAAVAQLDPIVPLYRVQNMTEHIALSLWRQRIAGGLLGLLGGLAVVLAALGLYGVVAHSVEQRRREIGIRMAIGAQRSHIYTLVIAQGLWWVLAGAAVGIPAALLATRGMQSAVPGVQPYDLPALAFPLALLGTVSLLACYFPARRASRVDPLAALRFE
jgi:predicted permease